MTLTKKLKKRLSSLPDAPGVYIMKDAKGEEIYVGKAKSLKDRVRSYFLPGRPSDGKVDALVASARDIDYIETASEVEAFILESRMIKDLQPHYNVRLKANQNCPFLEVTWGEDFPRVYVTRERGHKGSRYYGPFVGVKDLRAALQRLAPAFKFRTCTKSVSADDPKLRFNRPCLRHHIGRCLAPCSGLVGRKDYRASMRRFVMFLRGKKDEVLRALSEKMEKSSGKLEFEDAARHRDSIRAIEALERKGSLSDGIEPDVPTIDPREGSRRLGELLGLGEGAKTIEGIDVANLGGKEAVGAVVTFAEGSPLKGGYRRFRIKTVEGMDDYAMVREIVARRYRRLRREKGPVPDVVLVDGGMGHLKAAKQALEKVKVKPKALVSLAKKDERLYVLGRKKALRIPRTNPALKLVQFVRDEAHRFAQHYHHILRKKRVFD